MVREPDWKESPQFTRRRKSRLIACQDRDEIVVWNRKLGSALRSSDCYCCTPCVLTVPLSLSQRRRGLYQATALPSLARFIPVWRLNCVILRLRSLARAMLSTLVENCRFCKSVYRNSQGPNPAQYTLSLQCKETNNIHTREDQDLAGALVAANCTTVTLFKRRAAGLLLQEQQV